MTTKPRTPYPNLPSRDQVVRIEHKPTGLVLVVWHDPQGGGINFYNWIIADRSGSETDETRIGTEESFNAAHLTGLIELHKLVISRMQNHPAGRNN